MMPQHTPVRRVCRDCDGFAAVAITTGTRLPGGTRQTVSVVCQTCHGTGHRVPVASLAHIGR